jgi:ABC-2 type transport system permease protein
MSAVYKRELRAYLHNVYGWLFAAILILFVSFMMFTYNLVNGMPQFEYALSNSQYALLVLIPILCMRSMAEDKRNRTDMFYLSLPMQTSSVVLGKYFALLTVLTVPCALFAVYPLILGSFGEISYASAYLGLLLFFLLGAGLIAVCQFLSSLTENLVVSAVLSVAVSAILFFIPLLGYMLPDTPMASFIGLAVLALLVAAVAFLVTRNLNVTTITGAALILPLCTLFILMKASFTGLLSKVLEYVSPYVHFATFCEYGTLRLSGVILLLSYPVFFVFLTVQSADKKRWD